MYRKAKDAMQRPRRRQGSRARKKGGGLRGGTRNRMSEFRKVQGGQESREQQSEGMDWVAAKKMVSVAAGAPGSYTPSLRRCFGVWVLSFGIVGSGWGPSSLLQ
jgi:hypothetical protein